MSERKSYKTDLSDEQWALVEPVITAWKGAHPSVSGHQGRYAMREIVNALLYQGRTGCQWDLLPHDFPPPGAVKYYFCTWRDDGTDQTIHDLMRWQVREKMGRKADPSLVVLDTQSVHAAAGVPAESTGRDAAKKVPGRKRGLAVDVLGLVIAVVVVAASAHENAVGIALLDKVAADTDAVEKALVDRGFKNALVAHGQKVNIEVEVVERNPAQTGFVPKTLLELPDPQPPAPPAPRLPGHPACRQIMEVFTAADHPLRARQVCEAMDLMVAPNTINNTRLKLKRLADRAILVETEQGLFTQPRP
ncbi:IS5 family transposase [Streptomyces sp. NPDC054961]